MRLRVQVPGPWLDSLCRGCEKSRSSPSLRAAWGKSPTGRVAAQTRFSQMNSTLPQRRSDCRVGVYLGGALAHGVDQLLDDHVHALDARLLQLDDLLLHDSLKRHVGGEESSPARRRRFKKKRNWRLKKLFGFLHIPFEFCFSSKTNCGPGAEIVFIGDTDQCQFKIH